MTSKQYKMHDLKNWNNLQLQLMNDLKIPPKPDYVSAVAEWFVGLVDELGRLPTWEEIQAFFPTRVKDQWDS